ncbi:MAG: hypothetical protein KF886_11350 [Candidatus Hydrogenedentes bacterium]|nr:hypothetical protein [Candidatus Hydrogenedentota bacterium]
MLRLLAKLRPTDTDSAILRSGLALTKAAALFAMAAALALRVLSAFPAANAPHQHGGAHHSHASGGIAHSHSSDTANLLHRHGAEHRHTHAHLGGARRSPLPKTPSPDGGYTITIPVRHLPQACHTEEKEKGRGGKPATPDGAPQEHEATYYCAAASAALEAGPIPPPGFPPGLQTAILHGEGAPGREFSGAWRARAPPLGIAVL